MEEKIFKFFGIVCVDTFGEFDALLSEWDKESV